MSVPVSPTSPRTTLAVVVATASITLAVGVTSAAMLGYLGPRPSTPDPSMQEGAAPVDPATRPAKSQAAPRMPGDPSAAIVYVPVTPAQAAFGQGASPTAEAEPILALAAEGRFEDWDDDEDEEHGHHSRRSHDDDD